jgi:hypothetical protein
VTHDLAKEGNHHPCHLIWIVGEGPVAAPLHDDDLRVGEDLTLALGERDRNIGVVLAPDDERRAGPDPL